MKEIKITDPHRRSHFDFFRQMEMPHFSVTAQVPVTNLIRLKNQLDLHLSSTILYLICHAANQVKALRYRIRGAQMIEHAVVHPSFTVETKASDVFSFCYVDFVPDFKVFTQKVKEAIDEMQSNPSFEAMPGRDDYLFISALPWVQFTAMTHAMHTGKVDSVPRLTWGRIYETAENFLMPVNIQAHHAVVNGKDAGQFFQLLETGFFNPGDLLAG